MGIVMQQMMEVHIGMMRVLTQNLINLDSKNLALGMQQVLDNHSQMIQMIPQMLAVANNNLPQNNLGNKEPRGEAEITLLACKSCVVNSALTVIRATQLENVLWPMPLVSYAMESTVYLRNVSFTPRCNE
jgi:hypothetical protein